MTTPRTPDPASETQDTDATPATPTPEPAREPSRRAFLFHGAVDGLYNSRVYAEGWRLKEEIGKRSFPIIGGLGSKIMRLGEEWIMRPLRMATSFVIGTRKVEPESQLPEIPATLGRDLQRNLPESYHNRVEVVEGKNQAMHGAFNLSPGGFQQGNARATHAAAIAEVRTMPEEQVARSRRMEQRLAALETRGDRDSGERTLGELSPSGGFAGTMLRRALA